MFWISEEEMEEVRDRFFFFIRSDRRRQQNLGQNWFFFCHQAIFLAHTKIWEFQFTLVRLFCLLLLLQKLSSGGSNLTSSMGDSLMWDVGGGPDPGGDPDGPTKVDRDGDGVEHQWQFWPLIKQVKVGLNHFFSYGQRNVMASFGVQSKNGNTLPLLFDITFDFFWLNLTFKRSLWGTGINLRPRLITFHSTRSPPFGIKLLMAGGYLGGGA